MTKLIALIDGSIYSNSVCDHAAWIAERIDASLSLVHVLGRRHATGEQADFSGNLKLGARSALLQELADLDAQKSKLALQHGRLLLTEASEHIREQSTIEVDTKLRHGDLIETIEEFEQDADLIIIGKRGEAADFAKNHLGSNLERVVRGATKPVLVTSRAFKPIEKFVIAFDGGPSVMKAVNHIAQSKLFNGLSCLLLAAGELHKDARQSLEDAVAILNSAGIKAESATEKGDAETVIKTRIENDKFDLLVMGAYGHSRIRNLIIGSTTTEMVRSCHVPVMLFR